MAEAIYQFTTEISEENCHRALKVSCPRARMIQMLLVALMECLLGVYYWVSYSSGILRILVGIILFVLGIYSLIWAILLPERYAKENIQKRRVESGKNNVREELEFLENEILIHHLDLKKDFHIPYDYITRIYLFEDMVVYTANQNTGQIMKRDIPNEAEFIHWLTSKCNDARVKTVV